MSVSTWSRVGATLNRTFQFSFLWIESSACSPKTPHDVNQSTASGDNLGIHLEPGNHFWAQMPAFRGTSLAESFSLSLRVGWNLIVFRGLPQGPALSGEMEAFFRMVTYSLKSFDSVNKLFSSRNLCCQKISNLRWGKQPPQISAGSSENNWFYLCFSKVVGNFCCILRLSLQNGQNKTSTGDAGADPSPAQCLWRAERVGKLTTGRVALTCSQKICLFIGILGCSRL